MYDSVTPVLHDVLHWLLITERVNSNNGLLTYKTLNGLAPLYLSVMMVPVTFNPSPRRNWSADLTVPRAMNTSYGNRFTSFCLVFNLNSIFKKANIY